MKVIYGDEALMQKDTAIALGSFDGIHLGHQILIQTLVQESRQKNLFSMVFTFSNHPSETLEYKNTVQKLTTNEKKIEIIRPLRVDCVYFRPFTKEFLQLSPKTFIEKVLVEQMRVKLIVVGFNFRFGHKGAGDVDTLRQYADVYGYEVIAIPPVKQQNHLISSTEIRALITEGKVDTAKQLLGRPYSLKSIIVEGRKIGRTIGFPTINLQIEREFILPARGIYITQTLLGGRTYYSATNVGYNPTFDGKHMTVETYILDFNEMVYGQEAEVLFLERIRGEQKFDAVGSLIKRMQEDVRITKEYFEKYRIS